MSRMQRNVSSNRSKQRPEWDSTYGERENYALTPSELMQKKISHISKHRMEAKNEWQNVQEKLRNGVIDDETSRIHETAMSAKGLGPPKHGVTRRNLTQMMHLEDSRRSQQNNDNYQEDSCGHILDLAKSMLKRPTTKTQDDHEFINTIKQDLEDTKKLIQTVLILNEGFYYQVEKFNNKKQLDDPSRLIKQLTQNGSINKSKENIPPTNYQVSPPKPFKLVDHLGNHNDQFNSLNQLDDTMKFLSDYIQQQKSAQYQQEQPVHHFDDNFKSSNPGIQKTVSQGMYEEAVPEYSEYCDDEQQPDTGVLDLESLRQMLEQTRVELDHMNLTDRSMQYGGMSPIIQGKMVEVEVRRNLQVPSSPFDEDMQPRSFTIAQYDNKAIQRKHRDKHTSLNINDHI